MPKYETMNRAITRLTGEMVLAGLWSTSQMLHAEPRKAARVDRTVMFLALLAHSLPQADFGGPVKGVSVNALATSFNLPFESTRRQINVLLQEGWCLRGPSGVVIDQARMVSPAIRDLTATLHDLMVWLAEQYQFADLPRPVGRSASNISTCQVTLAAIELILATVDVVARGYDNMREFYLMNCIFHGSVRQVTIDPRLSREFGARGTIPPDAHRRGVNINRLAGRLGISAVTAYRQVGKALAAGKLEHCDGGVRGSAAFLVSTTIKADERTVAYRVERALERMAAAGFPFDRPATQYLIGSPTLPDWDR